MTLRAIPRAEWDAFLEGFSGRHRAWLATIHGIERGVPVTCVPATAFGSVRLEPHAAGPIVRVTLGNGVSLCAATPCAIRVAETVEGAEGALEIETTEEALLRLAFRATVLPEQLDGIAPGEGLGLRPSTGVPHAI